MSTRIISLSDAARLQSVAPDDWQAYFEVAAADYLGLRQKGGSSDALYSSEHIQRPF